jgi:FkbM family methyltransferase
MFFIKHSGYWICRHGKIPVGCDLQSDIVLKLKLPMNIVFDVGANIGQTAIKFNHEYRNAKIFSFEPVSSTFEKLVANTRIYERIKCNKLALGNAERTVDIRLYDESKSVLNSLNSEAMKYAGEKIESIMETTGDTFCAINGVAEIDLLKIDTEGYEIQVLEGFGKMMRESRIKALYCEVGFSPDNRRNTFINDLISFLYVMGYKFYGLYEVKNGSIRTGKNYGNALFINNNVMEKFKIA